MTISQANQFNDALSLILTEGLNELKDSMNFFASKKNLDNLDHFGLKDEIKEDVPLFEEEAFDELQDIVGYYEDLETAKADGESLTKLQESILKVYRDDREEEVNDLLSSIVRESAELKNWKKKINDALGYLEQI